MTRRYVFDIEASGLLDDSTVDYTASPWKLKDTFVIHCIVAIEKTTGEVVTFIQDECYTKFKQWVIDNVDEIVHFNGINFDMLACKAALDMDYTVGPDTWCGKHVVIDDLYIKSKTLNPDRRGHSVEYFGELLGYEKIDWRAKAVELGLIEYNAPRGEEFRKYHPAMLDYCIRDVQVTCKIDDYLRKEWGDWPWDEAYELEKAVAEIITRQSHRGFWFDVDLATENVKELDLLMAERKAIVEPTLPEKPMSKTKLKDYIPGAKQFLKNGEPNSNIIKWCEKHGGAIEQVADSYQTTLYGKTYTLPIPQEPIVSTEPSKIDDTTFIKGFLVEMGWKPTQYKERDLTVDTRKQKLSQEKFKETVERYVEQTLSSPFCKDRCERVKATRSTLREKLLKHDLKKPLKVYTNPTLTVGQEKEIDPTLVEMDSEFPHTQSIVEYLTYKHRRNSILGGGLDPDDWDEEDDNTAKGFLANVRSDGRIPTPADTCGAASGRMKHKLVCNIPRVTSLYGGNIRAMFGVNPDEQFVQYAYDFSSLEAVLEAHFCWKYDEDKAYCNSLLQEKPNDVHSVTARKISEMIGQAFGRAPAKSVKYACVPMHTQALTRTGWKYYDDISVGEEVLGYDAKTDTKRWTKILGKFSKEDEVIEFGNNWFKVQATNDHKWAVKQRREFSTGNKDFSVRKAVFEMRETVNLNSESNLIVNARMAEDQDTVPSGTMQVSNSKYNTDWCKRVLEMSQQERISFLEGFMIADGYHNDFKWQWSQNHGNLCEAALLATYLVHDKCVCVSERKDTKTPMKTVILTNKQHRTMQRMVKESKGVQPVWCIETELGTWVMRQGNTITITGNCTYGAQAARISKTVGCDLATGQAIFDAFWAAAKPLALLKEAVEKYWTTAGQKKFIPGLDKRKINTRSQHALLNSLFQSAGVICAKRVLVFIDRLCTEAGINVDCWNEDWKIKKSLKSMICMHDEQQSELSKSLVAWKKFADEEERKTFMKENPRWSAAHSDRGVFAGHSIADDILYEAIRRTNALYKLNVPLGTEAMYGRNWRETH